MVNKVLRALLAMTLFLGALPFATYAWARFTGGLPSEEVWWRRHGGNHGPWWGGPLELMVMLPLVALTFLPVVTVFVGLCLAFVARSARVFFYSLLLGGLQSGLAYAQFSVLFWTVD